MRHLEAGQVDSPVSVEQQIEVNSSRTEPRAAPVASELSFDREHPLEQSPWGEVRPERGRTVEEAWLLLEPDGIRFLERGNSHYLDGGVRFEHLERPTDRRLPVTEVRPEPDIDKRRHADSVWVVRRFAVVALLFLAAPGPAQAAPSATIPTGRALAALSDYRFTLLGLEADPGAERLVASRGGTIVAPELHIWRLPSPTAQRLIPSLRRAGSLRYAEPDAAVFRQGHLNGGDPLAAPNIGYHLYRVGADRAEPPAPGVPITVLDSGLDTTHMEFSARPNTILMNQQHVALTSEEYHGTIVSSTAAAPTDGKGTVGIYPQAVLRSFDLDFLSESAIVQGISRAAAVGRTVINLSLGGDEPSRSIYEAVISAFGRGCVIVAAAGNERLKNDPPIYPADFPHVLTVGSTNASDLPSDFSSTNQALDLAAPGEQIPWQHPLDPALYGTGTGTSFAAPIVTAATAWVWTVRPTLDKTQVFELMRLSARDIAPRGPDARTGHGLLDIPAALAKAAPAADPMEPNDDIDHVRAHGIFAMAARPLTAPGRHRAAYRARIQASEDPHDVYRVWVPGRSEVTTTIRPNADANAALWAPATRSVSEKGAARRRDLLATSARPGGRTEVLRVANRARRGYFAYLDVFLGRGVRSAGYALGLSAGALRSRPSTRR